MKEEKKSQFIILTRADSGLKESIDVARIKETTELCDGTTLIYTRYDPRTGEIFGHIVKESFSEVQKLLGNVVEIVQAKKENDNEEGHGDNSSRSNLD